MLNDQRPAPDALLMAQLMPRWPNTVQGHMFFYLQSSEPELSAEMCKQGYPDKAGIACPGFGIPDKRHVKTLSGADLVKLVLVFVSDPEIAGRSKIAGNLGRDISRYEWERARHWLAHQAYKEGVEYGRETDSHSRV